MTLFQKGLAGYLKWYYGARCIVEPIKTMDQVKITEYVLQEAIEGIYPDKCWWQTTSIKIFEELLGQTPVAELCDLIAVDILKEKKK
jgi:hypothetical protein